MIYSFGRRNARQGFPLASLTSFMTELVHDLTLAAAAAIRKTVER